jgi:nitrite reductase (NADH) small subunit
MSAFVENDFSSWIRVCERNALIPCSGIAALVNKQQIAIFYLPDHTPNVFVLDNWDPLGKAFVISRGIIGDQGGISCVASPLFKQHYALETGECLESKLHSINAWQSCWRGDVLWVAVGCAF